MKLTNDKLLTFDEACMYAKKYSIGDMLFLRGVHPDKNYDKLFVREVNIYMYSDKETRFPVPPIIKNDTRCFSIGVTVFGFNLKNNNEIEFNTPYSSYYFFYYDFHSDCLQQESGEDLQLFLSEKERDEYEYNFEKRSLEIKLSALEKDIEDRTNEARQVRENLDKLLGVLT